jgi:replicative DNA helicase
LNTVIDYNCILNDSDYHHNNLTDFHDAYFDCYQDDFTGYSESESNQRENESNSNKRKIHMITPAQITSYEDSSASLLIHNMPAIPEAEQAILGAIFYENSVIEKFVEFLKAEHFFIPLHSKIYDLCLKVIGRGQVIDPLLIRNYLIDDEAFQDLGGDAYLTKLMSSFISLSQAQEYARQVYDAYLRREIIKISDESIANAKKYVISEDANKQIENMESKLFRITQDNAKQLQKFQNHVLSVIQMAESAFKKDSHVVGTTTGLIDLDKLLGGLHPSDLIILAGRPSMGKTALATNIAFNAAMDSLNRKTGETVLFFSLEMSSEQLTMRLLSQDSGIPSDKVRRGAISQEDFISFVNASKNLYDLPLLIDDSATLNIPLLRTRVRRASRKQKISLIVIDYLQLLYSDNWGDNRVQQLSEVSRGLKAIAKEFSVPVLALSQLSRAVEQREDKRPQLSDLRESGSIEQDADVVMFIYREEYYQSRKKPDESSEKFAAWQNSMQSVHNMAEVIVAKQRHGPIDIVNLRFEAKLTKFDNFFPGHE